MCRREFLLESLLLLVLWSKKWYLPLGWSTVQSTLKGHGNEEDFLGFLQKLLPHESLTLSLRLQIRGDIHIRKTTTCYHRYGESLTPRRVANSPHHWYAESPTPRITYSRSQRLLASPIRRVGYWNFLKKTLCIYDMESRWLPAPVIRWVADSRVIESESRRLSVSLICGVDDFTYHWVGESITPRIGDTGSRYSKK